MLNNEITVKELVITKAIPAVVEYNHEEIKASLDVFLDEYMHAVVTKDTVKMFKDQRASLNKLAKTMDKFRKDTKKELSKNIKPFEENVKTLHAQILDAVNHIDGQVKFFEDQLREERHQVALDLIDQTAHEIQLKPEYRQRVVVLPEYCNLSLSNSKLKQAIVDQFTQLKTEQDIEQQKTY